MQVNTKKDIEKSLETFVRKKLPVLTTEVADYVRRFILTRGKRIRPLLMYYGYRGCGGTKRAAVVRAAGCWELAHSYLLIHDDIIDRDQVRRGEPTLWKKFSAFPHDSHYGISLALIVGDMVNQWAHELLHQSSFSLEKKIKAAAVFDQIMAEVCYGQLLDLEASGKKEVSEKDIITMYTYKTARYTVAGPLLVGAILAGADGRTLSALSQAATPLGIAFQIQDDILGIFGDESRVGKPVGSDLQEGKKTLLLAKTMERARSREKDFFAGIAHAKKISKQELAKAREIIISSGALSYCRELAKTLVGESTKEISRLPWSTRDKKELFGVAEYVIRRSL